MGDLLRRIRPLFNSMSSKNEFKVIYHRILPKKRSSLLWGLLIFVSALVFCPILLFGGFVCLGIFLHSKGRTGCRSPIPHGGLLEKQMGEFSQFRPRHARSRWT